MADPIPQNHRLSMAQKRNNGAIIHRIGLKSITVTLPAPS